MARLAIVGALLMFLLALTEASIYRTVITTEVNDQSETCQRELSRVSMNSCIRYLQQPYMLLPRVDVSQEQQLCCQELGQVSRECRCDAVRQIVQTITGSQGGQQQGHRQQQKMKEVTRVAQQLPSMCGMEPQYCRIQQEEFNEAEMCQSQLRRTRMDSCMRYLQPYQMMFPSVDVSQAQQQCCQELGKVSKECRCDAVRQTVQTITESQGGQQQGQEQEQEQEQEQQKQMEEVMKTAQQLPKMCGMEPQYCQIQQQGYGELNARQSEMCRSQLRHTGMNSCMRYLQPYMLLPRVDVSQAQQQCCQELGQVSRDCRCEAVKQIVQTITESQGGQQQQQQMEEVMRTAQQLPKMCGMEPQYCRIQQY